MGDVQLATSMERKYGHKNAGPPPHPSDRFFTNKALIISLWLRFCTWRGAMIKTPAKWVLRYEHTRV